VVAAVIIVDDDTDTVDFVIDAVSPISAGGVGDGCSVTLLPPFSVFARLFDGEDRALPFVVGGGGTSVVDDDNVSSATSVTTTSSAVSSSPLRLRVLRLKLLTTGMTELPTADGYDSATPPAAFAILAFVIPSISLLK
jgi:hypothetical protein